MIVGILIHLRWIRAARLDFFLSVYTLLQIAVRGSYSFPLALRVPGTGFSKPQIKKKKKKLGVYIMRRPEGPASLFGTAKCFDKL